MGTEFFGTLSGALVALSAVPYAIRTAQGKIAPNFVTWGLWTFIGLAILLTYKQAGAKDSIWAAVFGFTNPLLITAIVVTKRYLKHGKEEGASSLLGTVKGMWAELTSFDHLCGIFGLCALALWLVAVYVPALSLASLGVAILADVFAVGPTIVALWKNPQEDRPFAWTLFSLGYALSFGAVAHPTVGEYVLPIYMTGTSLLIALPLILHRIRHREPILEWI